MEPSYTLTLTTPGMHYMAVPINAAKVATLRADQVGDLVAGLTGHARASIDRQVSGLGGPSAFFTIDRPGVALTVTRRK